mmetsp:Transcript_45663/g.108744  ORF Transcript_45663/g.108744 Transcript_45663/m.108744 type:complete len:439 (+) Transcript_45663:79-1395(+)
MELLGTNDTNFLRGNTAMLTPEEKSTRQMVYGPLLAVSGSIIIIAATLAVQMKKGWPWCKACASCWGSLSKRCQGGQQPRYTRVASEKGPAKEALVPGQKFNADDDSSSSSEEGQRALLPATAEEEKEIDLRVLDAERGLRSTHEKFVRMRRMLLSALFVFYVSCSVGLPYLNASQASCINGFFWEDHMPFLFLFLVTKALELMVYVNDPTMEEARLEWFPFMKTFVPSFLGYIDAYTDATAIVITATCPAEGSELLAKWMIGFYILGVVVAQWMVALTMACGDETHACLMKLIHWDTCASCISLPPENKSAWVAVNLARTFLEDIPQAVLQSIFLLRIRPNPFMLVSVAIGVCSSMKGVVDATKRGVAAAAAFAQALEEVRAGAADEALPGSDPVGVPAANEAVVQEDDEESADEALPVKSPSPVPAAAAVLPGQAS